MTRSYTKLVEENCETSIKAVLNDSNNDGISDSTEYTTNMRYLDENNTPLSTKTRIILAYLSLLSFILH